MANKSPYTTPSLTYHPLDPDLIGDEEGPPLFEKGVGRKDVHTSNNAVPVPTPNHHRPHPKWEAKGGAVIGSGGRGCDWKRRERHGKVGGEVTSARG